jgi:hypothetical protein
MTNNARVAILSALKDVGNYLLPQTTLFADVSIRLGQPITHTEFRELLCDAEAKGRVVSVRDEDGTLKWKITDNGRARLAELT